MYNYHDIFFYYAFGALNGGGGSIQVIGITEGTTSVTFESNGKPLITYRIYGSSSGVGDLNAETGKYDITVTCNEDTYTISLDAPLMDGEYIDYKTQRLYPSGLDVSMPEISTIEGTNTLTVITTNPSSKVYVECYRAKDIPLPVASTIIGSVPFEFQCYEAGNLMDYSISGNAVQDGTPSADAPVDATGSGVRTANLFTGEYSQFDNVGGSGNTYAYFYAPNTTIRLIAKDDYTTPLGMYLGFTVNGGDAAAGYRWVIFPEQNYAKGEVVGLTIPEGYSFVSLFQKKEKTLKELTDHFYVMLNLGSTALPYEPYGYKLPLTVNGTEYPIYLGQVETTRRVKKLVLTGEETINFASEDANRLVGYFIIPTMGMKVGETGYCNILLWKDSYSQSEYNRIVANGSTRFYMSLAKSILPEPTIDGFIAYLKQQYAAGTPVTVWYVLAEPETTVVNEPLMKIGDYADTITFDQAGVNIPVIKGNNVLTINTDVPPSETYIKYNGKEKEYGYYITSDGYIYTTSDGYKYGIRS